MNTQEPVEEREVVTSLRLTVSEYEFLKAFAHSQERSMGGQIRYMIAQLRAKEDQSNGRETAA